MSPQAPPESFQRLTNIFARLRVLKHRLELIDGTPVVLWFRELDKFDRSLMQSALDNGGQQDFGFSLFPGILIHRTGEPSTVCRAQVLTIQSFGHVLLRRFEDD